jgi:alpha-amylase/alpha-mannosidase (GH57 family)
MNKFLCIHGHFYQPPRENPWLESIELQDSASPYHDWNERVLAECYAPNAVSRILDSRGTIDHIVNNYANISFDFGPTLLSWLKLSAGEVYQAILAADRESRERFTGHGSAMAQAYNHVILPLANPRDKATQIIWGLRDFEARFGRMPEGMWLPETAVDLETLDLLAQQGMRFVLLAPHQAQRVRRKNQSDWQDIHEGRMDTARAYEVELPSGRTIAAFFYHDTLARAIAFEGLLSNGDAFARRLLDSFSVTTTEPQLIHAATDGESYGHHHRFGDMALAYALHKMQLEGAATLTNYGEFLEKNQPQWRAEIAANTSWSCAHGVERWRSDCGCASGGHPAWRQAWRGPLRDALDALREELAPLYEGGCADLLQDAWRARDTYIAVVLDRSPESLRRFFQAEAKRELTAAEQTRALKLLEMQRHVMLMYTSCGWFFDDLAGIEAVQNLLYAGRAVQLAQELFGDGVEERFLRRLEIARSNGSDSRTGRELYRQAVRPAMVDLPKVAAHYAVSSLFESYGEQARIYCYQAERQAHRIHEAGRAKLALGRVRITSEITRESDSLCYGVLHFGDHNFTGGVRCIPEGKPCDPMNDEPAAAFLRGDFPEVIRFFDSRFSGLAYTLEDLFRDEQRIILARVIEENLAESEAVYSQLYENHAALLHFLIGLKIPPPPAFQAAASVAINSWLRREMEAVPLAVDRINNLLEQARAAQVDVNAEALAFSLKQSIDRLAIAFQENPADVRILSRLLEAAKLARSMPFRVDLWKPQNVYYQVLMEMYPGMRQRADANGEATKDWVRLFLELGERLQVRTDGEGKG